MSKTIEIKTCLHSSLGGGETCTHYTWSVGPRNLRTAVAKLAEHRSELEQLHGNVGCGASWIEIGNVRVADFDVELLLDSDNLLCGSTLTQAARELIADVQSGRYGQVQELLRAQAEAELHA